MNLQLGGFNPGAVTPVLPQSPFPYTSALHISQYAASVNTAPTAPQATWNSSEITSMNISGGGNLEFLSSPNDTISSFVDTNILGVRETYDWAITATGISWDASFTSLDLDQVLSDPSYSGSENGTWVAIGSTIPDPANTAACLGLSSLALTGLRRRFKK